MRRFTTLSLVLLFVQAGVAPVSAQWADALRKLTEGDTPKPIKTIAHFQLEGGMVETPSKVPPLFGSKPPTSMKLLLDRFRSARLDENVVAVLVDLENVLLGFAQLQELNAAMRQFAAVDKEVYVHADSLRTLTYAAACGASHISIVPTGDVWLVGLYAERPYLRNALDKLGCQADFEHCGDFKTAPESFTRTGPSDAAKEMTKWLVDGEYDELVNLIASSRGVTPKKVRKLIDNGPYTAQAAMDAGLIDSVQHRHAFMQDLKKRHGKKTRIVRDYGSKDSFDMPQDPFALIPWVMELLNPSRKSHTGPSVGVVFVEGMIQLGTGESSPFGGPSGAFSTDIRKALDQAAKDRSVKAVVLRVDSPGGSALASEVILDAARRLAAKKPLIVSMGNVAASGGYYVSCAASTILANPATITGSIGVFGGKLVTTGLWDKLGVNWHVTRRGAMSGLLSSAAPFTDPERAKMRELIDGIYDTFLGHVRAARGDLLAKPVEEIAGGRVYTGRQALELGLVDKLGGFQDAVKTAAQQAGISEYEIRVIPEPLGFFELLMGRSSDSDEFVGIGGTNRHFLTDSPLVRSLFPALAGVDPLRARAVLQALQCLEIMQREGVMMMWPGQLVIR